MIKIDKVYKIIYALYDDEKKLLNSVKYLKKKKIFIYDVYTPFPVHGLNKFLKLNKSKISIFSFVYGIFGIILSITITWYTMIFDWPQNIGGKPSFSWYMNLPSFVPIIFEIMIFCSAHFMCITYFFYCGLFPGNKSKNPDPRTTDDKFLIEIHINKNIEKSNLFSFLRKKGATEIIFKNTQFS
jgi:hypothetical protein